MKAKDIPMMVARNNAYRNNNYRTYGSCIIYECNSAEEYSRMRRSEIIEDAMAFSIAFLIVLVFMFIFMAIIN